MRTLKSAALAAVIFAVTVSPALSWDATVEGPDVFGQMKALGGTTNGRDTLVIQCDSAEDLFLAFLVPIPEFEETPVVPATFLIQIDDAQPRELVATLRGWNKSNAGIVVEGRRAENVEAIELFGTAKRRINIGFVINGKKGSATFDARGSTKAVRRLVEACKLGDIKD